MKALVTGATGFIGSLLCEELAKRGVEVRVIARNPAAFKSQDPLIKTVRGDLSNPESLKTALDSIDIVFHLAGLTSAVKTDEYYRTNGEGTLNLLKAVEAKIEAGHPIKRFIYISSLAAGAPSTSLKPHTETDPSSPVSAYGKSKKMGEDHVLNFGKKFPVLVLRPPMVFGPRDKQLLMLAKVVKKGLVVEVAGSNREKTKYYSMIYVKDMVAGIIHAALDSNGASVSNPVYYLSDPTIYSYDQILAAMMKSLGVRAFRIKIPFALARVVAWSLQGLSMLTRKSYPMNPDKLHDLRPDYWICSPDRAKRELGFQTRYGLEDGMHETIRWYVDSGWL